VHEWAGVEVKDGHVSSLVLGSHGLNGNLPSSIGNLTGLVELKLEENFLSGNIPFSFGNLTNLQTLALDG
jgi:Leucine-rich repeat (LRR) protein